MKKLISVLICVFFLMSLVSSQQIILGSAIAVDADYVTIYPGEEAQVSIDIENRENYDLEDVSVNLVLDQIPFTVIGSSSKEIDEIEEDDSEDISFTLKASTDATPGDYNIPYKVIYTNNNGNLTEKTGSFGIRVSARTDLAFSVETQNPVINEQGTLSLKIINKGLGNVKFISVEVFPQGYELLSSKNIYIGTISSDEDDLATFDVIFKSTSPKLSAKVEYKDFENQDKIETVNLPVTVYTQEKALELGLIQESNLNFYLGLAAIVIILWILWGRLKKRRKKRNRS
ncbi:hypothetical protein K9L16_03900 [Candidatus Pacearchaeota archaeon]|nr:hypothetical protein [Candidatus Pacearchaeota archaeon]